MTSSPAIEGKPIVLIGFMGSGKSTVGRLLAARLGRELVDLDDRIEVEAGATVAEIFATEGEAGFRAREAALLASALDRGGAATVIAAGGGAPCHGKNLERMLAAGVVIALSASPDEILKRVGDAAGRPLLAGARDRRAEVTRLLEARGEIYRRAHFTVDTDGRAPSKVLAAILERLGC